MAVIIAPAAEDASRFALARVEFVVLHAALVLDL
jgi:hypothetical protein